LLNLLNPKLHTPLSVPSTRGGAAGAGSPGEFAELPDGRARCLECASTAVIPKPLHPTPYNLNPQA